MKNTLSFENSILDSFQTQITVSKWDEVMEAYEKAAHRKAILTLLDYVDVNIRKNYAQEDETFFEIPHGSITIKLWITDTIFKVVAPFLKITDDTKIVPLYRHVAELNFHPLRLPQITLDNGELDFTFETAIHLCEPFKIYYLLKDICTFADRHDDEFITKFKAAPLREPKIEKYDATILEKGYNKIQEFLEEALNFIQYLEDKRYTNYIWDVVNLTLKRIDFYIAPQGNLKTELEENINALYAKEPFENRIQKGKQYLTELKNKEKQEILDDIYIAEVFVPFKYRSNLADVKENWKNAYATAEKEMKDGHFMGACFSLTVAIYDMFYYANIPDDIAKKTINLLQNTSEKPWNVAARELYDGMTKIMNNQPLPLKGSKNQSNKKSFFKKLFG